ncbi:hypothetical protein ABE527_02400 [Brucella sp. TWI432]
MKTVLVMIAILHGAPVETPIRDYSADQAALCVADMHAAWEAGFDSACIPAGELDVLALSPVCRVAAYAPTDANLEACYGIPVEEAVHD